MLVSLQGGKRGLLVSKGRGPTTRPSRNRMNKDSVGHLGNMHQSMSSRDPRPISRNLRCGKASYLAALQCGYPVAHSVVDELGQRMEAQLEHDLSSVCLNGPDGDSQLRCDFLICFPLGQEADDFNLARSGSGTGPLTSPMPASCLEKSLQHDFGYFRCEETLALRNGFHGFREALREIGFQKVP